jgi:hypothetical protein
MRQDGELFDGRHQDNLSIVTTLSNITTSRQANACSTRVTSQSLSDHFNLSMVTTLSNISTYRQTKACSTNKKTCSTRVTSQSLSDHLYKIVQRTRLCGCTRQLVSVCNAAGYTELASWWCVAVRKLLTLTEEVFQRLLCSTSAVCTCVALRSTVAHKVSVGANPSRVWVRSASGKEG